MLADIRGFTVFKLEKQQLSGFDIPLAKTTSKTDYVEILKYSNISIISTNNENCSQIRISLCQLCN